MRVSLWREEEEIVACSGVRRRRRRPAARWRQARRSEWCPAVQRCSVGASVRVRARVCVCVRVYTRNNAGKQLLLIDLGDVQRVGTGLVKGATTRETQRMTTCALKARSHTATEKRETRNEKTIVQSKTSGSPILFLGTRKLDDFHDRQPTDCLPPRKILTNQREVQ